VLAGSRVEEDAFVPIELSTPFEVGLVSTLATAVASETRPADPVEAIRRPAALAIAGRRPFGEHAVVAAEGAAMAGRKHDDVHVGRV
jgi:hypothetical protein